MIFNDSWEETTYYDDFSDFDDFSEKDIKSELFCERFEKFERSED